LEGIVTVIAGRVNAGKSSLLNRLLKEKRAIVTPIPGTTRDIIESTIHIEGLPIRLTDTAGFRKVKGEVERIGLHLTEKKLAEADLLLIVIDQSRPLNQDDLNILSKSSKKNSLVVINKIDLPPALDENQLKRVCDGFPTVKISALTGEGVQNLRQRIKAQVVKEDMGTVFPRIVPNLRHKNALEEASRNFVNAARNMKEPTPLEIVATDLNWGLEKLGEIVGETVKDEILDEIFSRFCIGK
jgi:tRNA modification GTPase